MANWKREFRKRKRLEVTPDKKIALFAKLIFIFVVIGILGVFVVIPLFAFNLPSPDKIVRREGFSTQILDRNGKILYDVYEDVNRKPVEESEIPSYLKQATIAIEDKNFYKHQGFDPLGMLRGFSRLFTRGYAQGGSTLTQQLVKNVLLTSQRSVVRKIKEFILAIQIERKYSKDEILRMYLNEAPYGGTAIGVASAAEQYFGKEVGELNLVESAFLAGLPQRPSFYSPYSGESDAYIPRAEAVLKRMKQDGYITKDQEKEAAKGLPSLEIKSRGASYKAPHFVTYVQKLLEERYGPEVVQNGGLKVTTTLDSDLQEEAQKIVSEEIEKVEYLHITNGASVVLDPQTGEILAMIGSKDFNAEDYDGQVNVTLSLRQPGSSIKPIVYLTAFKKGYTPSTLLMDVPTEFPGGGDNPVYKPVNYDGEYRGPMQLRYALANSINVIAVKTQALIGIKDTLATAYDLGIGSLEPTKETLDRVGLSLALGGGEVRLLELTGAYGSFMNGGYKIDSVAILQIEDRNGKTLEETKPQKGKRVMSEAQAFLIADILSDNQARSEIFGLNSALYIAGHDIAVKTGTTNNKKDNWTIGGNQNIIVGVWVGNNDNSEMREVASGVTGASPIWRRIILEGLRGKPKISFDPPDSVERLEVDSISGYLAHDGFSSRQEYFEKGTIPQGDDPIHVKIKVCKSDGNLATPADIAGGNYDEKEFYVFKEEDPTAASGEENKWQKGILEWLSDSSRSDSKYHPPTVYCGGSTVSSLNVEFASPKDRDSNLSNTFEIKVQVDSVKAIEQVDFEIDGKHVRGFTAPPYSYTVDNLSSGVHTLRAVATDIEDKSSDRVITVGVGVPWDFTASPSPTP